MNRRRIAAALACIGITLAVQAASAQAQAFPSNPLKLLPIVHFEGTNGYELTAYGGRDTVGLFVEEGRTRVTYDTTDARAGLKRLVGDFGAAGSIDMPFHGRGEARTHTLQGCEGTYKLRRGVWIGEMRFVGEGGFTSVFTTEAPGRTITSVDIEACNRGARGERGNTTRRGYGLVVEKGDAFDGNGTVLNVSWFKRGKPELAVLVGETSGPVSVTYETFTHAPHDQVHANRKRGRARVAAGPPFAGAAKFRADDEDVDISIGTPVEAVASWEGDLAVTLPGLGAVPLTGPRFRADWIHTITQTTFALRPSAFGSIAPPFDGMPAN